MEAIDIDHDLVVVEEFDALYVKTPPQIPIAIISNTLPFPMPSRKMDPHTHNRNHNFRDHVKCRTKSLLQSAVSAAVSVALTIPFISKLPLTDVARRSVEVNNVAELEAGDGESPKRYPGELKSLCVLFLRVTGRLYDSSSRTTHQSSRVESNLVIRSVYSHIHDFNATQSVLVLWR